MIIDAIGCQKEIAQQIVDQEADYLLAVRANQEHLLADIELLASACRSPGMNSIW